MEKLIQNIFEIIHISNPTNLQKTKVTDIIEDYLNMTNEERLKLDVANDICDSLQIEKRENRSAIRLVLIKHLEENQISK